MQLYKTVENDEYLRLEEECEGSVTVYINGGTATILSLQVPKSDRREGVGEALIKSCGSLLYERGVSLIEADFLQEISGMEEFFREMDYKTEEGIPLMSVEVSALTSNKRVKKTLQIDSGEIVFEPLSELFVVQWDEFMDTLQKLNIRLTNADMARFSQELSGVVYDSNNELRAFILCTEEGKSLHVDLVASIGTASPAFVMTAIQGMLKGIVEAGGASRFKTVTYLMVNEKIAAIFERVLNGDIEPEKLEGLMAKN